MKNKLLVGSLMIAALQYTSTAYAKSNLCEKTIQQCQSRISTLQSALQHAQAHQEEGSQGVTKLNELLGDAQVSCSADIAEACR